MGGMTWWIRRPSCLVISRPPTNRLTPSLSASCGSRVRFRCTWPASSTASSSSPFTSSIFSLFLFFSYSKWNLESAHSVASVLFDDRCDLINDSFDSRWVCPWVAFLSIRNPVGGGFADVNISAASLSAPAWPHNSIVSPDTADTHIN